MRIGINASGIIESTKKAGTVYVTNFVSEFLKICNDNGDKLAIYFSDLTEDQSLSGFLKKMGIEEMYQRRGRYSTRFNLEPINCLLWNQFILPRILKRNKVDVLFNVETNGPLRTPIPQFTKVHTLVFHFFPSMSRYYHFQTEWFIPRLLSQSKGILAVSETIKKQVSTLFGFDPSRIVVAPNGYNKSLFKPEPYARKDIRANYELDDFLLFVGTLETRKNAHRVIQAYLNVMRIVDCDLVMIGSPSLRMVRFLREAVKRGKGHIHLLNYISHEELPKFYSAARIFVFPSLYEGHPLSLIEAMACGAPTITSKGGACEETVKDCAITVDPTKTSDIAQALVSLSDNSKLRNDLSRKGIKHAQAFSWKKTAAKVYKTLVGEFNIK